MRETDPFVQPSASVQLEILTISHNLSTCRSINAPEVQAGSLRVSDALRQWVAVARVRCRVHNE